MRCLNRRTGRTPRVHFNIGIKGRVEVEIVERVANACDMLTRMCAQQLRIGRGSRFPPFPVVMSIVYERRSARHPLRPFWMAGARIFQTAWVVVNCHEACKVLTTETFRNKMSQAVCHVER